MSQIFNEITKDDFFLRKNSEQFQKFANEITSKLGRALRDITDRNVIESNNQHVEKHDSKYYLNELKGIYNYKIGVNVGDSDFLIIAFNTLFIKNFAYFWLGGNGKSTSESKNSASLIETSFLGSFFDEIKEQMELSLYGFGLGDSTVTLMEDKSIAPKNTAEIFINNIEFQIDDDIAKLAVIGTTSAINSLKSEKVNETTNEYSEFVEHKLKHELIIELCEINVSLDAIANIAVGDIINIKRLESSINNASVKIKGIDGPIFNGEILQNSNNNRLLKIKEKK